MFFIFSSLGSKLDPGGCIYHYSSLFKTYNWENHEGRGKGGKGGQIDHSPDILLLNKKNIPLILPTRIVV